MNSSLTQKASGTFQIPSLDGIRAVSILIVFLSHAGLNIIPGLFGVTIFFFLSGYLITTLLRLEHERTGAISIRDFYIRRILRIFPPFYFTLFCIVIFMMIGILPGTFRWAAVNANALQLSNVWELVVGEGAPFGTRAFWSLAIEEHFYLLFPFVFILIIRWFPKALHQFLALGFLAACVLLWRFLLITHFHAVTLIPGEEFYPRIAHGTDTRFDALLFGCMLAVYGNPALDKTHFSRPIWIGVLFPLGLALLGLSFYLHDPLFRQTARFSLQGIALFFCFIAVIRFPDWGPFKMLNWSWVRFLGVLSYSIYLVHASVIYAVEYWLPKFFASVESLGYSHKMILSGSISWLLTLGIATMMHYGLEKPFVRLRKKLSHLRPTSAPPPHNHDPHFYKKPSSDDCHALRKTCRTLSQIMQSFGW